MNIDQIRHQTITSFRPERDVRLHKLTGNGALVLVVDDHIALCEMTKCMLNLSNYRVLSATDPSEALTIFTKQKDEIALVLTDLLMPEMDGWTLIREMKAVGTNAQFVLMTGGDPPEAADLEKGQIRYVLQKPFNPEQLLTIIKQALDR